LTRERRAEGTAKVYNKKKKGAWSCYHLFCTIAQPGQIFDVLFRSGNFHDSNAAREFIERSFKEPLRRDPRYGVLRN
jgi:hypothetical protein